MPRVRLGSLVPGNTYRNPAVMAKAAAKIDIISGGRIVLGLGAGWQENEHNAYGIPFYTVAERLKRLEEACKSSAASSTRPHGRRQVLQRRRRAARPQAAQRLPILIGGGGEKVTLKIAARYADEWNIWGLPETPRAKIAVLDAHCEALGRDPKEIERSALALLALTDDPAVDRTRPRRRRPPDRRQRRPGKAAIKQYIDAGVEESSSRTSTSAARRREEGELDRFIKEIAPAFR